MSLWNRWRTTRRWRPVLRRMLEQVPSARERAEDRAKDRNGCYSAGLASSLRTIGACEYIVNRDVNAFRANLVESAQIQAKLFKRYDGGEKEVSGYVSMVSYTALLDALASGNMGVAAELAQLIGGRPEAETNVDNPFTESFGYSLKYIVLKDDERARGWVARLTKACVTEGFARNFKAYPHLMESLLERKAGEAQRTLPQLISDHQRESQGSGSFRGTVDEYLCMWGIGVINLCRWRGVPVQGEPPLIPGELLI